MTVSISIARIDQVIALLDAQISSVVDEVLHHPKFQALEASWRGLAYVVDRVAFDQHNGELARGLEAAHSRPRVLHAGGDATGFAIESATNRGPAQHWRHGSGKRAQESADGMHALHRRVDSEVRDRG